MSMRMHRCSISAVRGYSADDVGDGHRDEDQGMSTRPFSASSGAASRTVVSGSRSMTVSPRPHPSAPDW
jgi:hypothetical protein